MKLNVNGREIDVEAAADTPLLCTAACGSRGQAHRDNRRPVG